MKRLRTISTAASVIVCCALVIMLPVSYHRGPWTFDEKSRKISPTDSVALTSHFHLGFFSGGVWFYGHEIPYMGSIRSMSDDKGIIYKGGHTHEDHNLSWYAGDYGIAQTTLIGERGEFVEKDRYCDLPGVYFRCFDEADNPRPDWTLMVSIWYLILLFAILPTLWIYRRVRFRLAKKKT